MRCWLFVVCGSLVSGCVLFAGFVWCLLWVVCRVLLGPCVCCVVCCLSFVVCCMVCRLYIVVCCLMVCVGFVVVRWSLFVAGSVLFVVC